MAKEWIYGAVCAAVVVTFGLVFARCGKGPEKPQAQLEAAEQKAEVASTKTEASFGKETAKTTGTPKDATPKFTVESDFEFGLTVDSEGIVINEYVGNGGSIVIPAMIQGFPVQEIAGQVFQAFDAVDVALYGAVGIQSVVIPTGITSIGALAFGMNENLISADVPASVKNIGNQALSKTGLTAVTIYVDTTYDYGVYSGYKVLKTVTIQDGVTALPSLFGYCTSLQTVSIPDSVVEIRGSAFRGCTNLSTVTFSPGIKRKWDGGSFSENCFEDCPKRPLATQAALRKASYTGSF